MAFRAQANRDLQPAKVKRKKKARARAKKKPAKKKARARAKKKPAKSRARAKKKPAKSRARAKKKPAKKKPAAKKRTKVEQRLEREAGNLVGKALEAGINVGVSQSAQIAQAGKDAIRRTLEVGALPAGVALTKIGAVGSAGLVAAAFALGYGVGTAAVALWRRLQPDELLYRMALATRKARLEWEAARGRKATKAETQAIGSGLKEAIQRAKLLRDVPDLASAGLP